ncbi:MAG TPA: hypothetical protein VI077_13400 [Pseudolabrys sp.]
MLSIPGRIGNAYTAETAQRLKTLLLGIEVALGIAVIIRDRTPRKILRINGIDDQNRRHRKKAE